MQDHLLNKFGFKTILINEKATPKAKKSQWINSTISIVKPLDHANPQIVIKINREVLDQMKWEISDRVSIMANLQKQNIALIKTNKKQKNTFAISSQGASLQVARENKRGGVVKVGWRDNLSNEIVNTGTFNTKIQIFEGALIVKLPKEIFDNPTIIKDLLVA